MLPLFLPLLALASGLVWWRGASLTSAHRAPIAMLPARPATHGRQAPQAPALRGAVTGLRPPPGQRHETSRLPRQGPRCCARLRRSADPCLPRGPAQPPPRPRPRRCRAGGGARGACAAPRRPAPPPGWAACACASCARCKRAVRTDSKHRHSMPLHRRLNNARPTPAAGRAAREDTRSLQGPAHAELCDKQGPMLPPLSCKRALPAIAAPVPHATHDHSAARRSGAHACRCSERWSTRPPCSSPAAAAPAAAAPRALALTAGSPASPAAPPAAPPPTPLSAPPAAAPLLPLPAPALSPPAAPACPRAAPAAALAGPGSSAAPGGASRSGPPAGAAGAARAAPPRSAASSSGNAAADSASVAFRSQPAARAARRRSNRCCRSRVFSPWRRPAVLALSAARSATALLWRCRLSAFGRWKRRAQGLRAAVRHPR